MKTDDKFVQNNLGLVHACCHRFKGKGIEYDDLYQAGCLGLVKAAKGFDETRGLMFSTYAVPVILGEIKRLFRDGGAVKVGRTLKELSLKVGREYEKMSKSLGREPSVSELAEEMEISKEEVAEALCAAQPTLSLTIESDDGSVEIDVAVDGENDRLIESLSLKEIMNKLPDDDRRLIVLRYYKFKTQTETAKEMGITQVQVSRREKTILMKMRQLLV